MSLPVKPPPRSDPPSSSPETNFEDLCLDPYQSNFDSGRDEGHAAGLKAGYDEGRKLGHQKGLEVGIELGYMHGVATTIQTEVLPTMAQDAQDDSNSIRRVQKIEKSIDELIEAIDGFPSPDEIFRREEIPASSGGVEYDHDDELHRNDSDGTQEAAAIETNDEAVDISGRMQRIRAKFKLLCVQLKVPELSLTKVMDDAKSTAATPSVSNETNKERTSKDTDGSAEGHQDW